MSTLPTRNGPTPHTCINDASFYGPDGEDQIAWDALHDIRSPSGGAGTDEGKILVQLIVDDGEMDIVYADLGATDDLAAIERAIEILQRLHAGLSGLYAGAVFLPVQKASA